MTKYIYVIFIVAFISSCKKDNYKIPPIGSLTLVNVITGGKPIKLGSRVTSIANNSSSQLALKTGENELYVWPVGDSTHPYYTDSKFNIQDREVYSLFLAGTESSVSGVLIKEDIPYRTDSTGGVRFINLSPNSPLLNINLVSTPSVSEVSNLGYKQYSDFRTYPALANTVPYSFQIKNATTGVVLSTYAFNSSNLPRFSNITLVIRGMVGVTSGAQAFGITRVAQDR